MAIFMNDFTAVFWIAVNPGLCRGRHHRVRPCTSRNARRTCARCARRCSAPRAQAAVRVYWMIVGVTAIFTLARFSEAFLLLRAANRSACRSRGAAGAGGDERDLYRVGMAGRRAVRRIGRYGLSRRISRCWYWPICARHRGSVAVVMLGVALWGLQMGLTQGLLSGWSPTPRRGMRGTAFGLFNLVSGVAMLRPASSPARCGTARSRRHLPRRRRVHGDRAGGVAFVRCGREDHTTTVISSPPA